MYFTVFSLGSKLPLGLCWASSALRLVSSSTKKLTDVAAHLARICSRSACSLSTFNSTSLRGLVSGLAATVGLGKSKKRLRVTKGVLDIVCPFRLNRCLLVAASFPLRNCRAWPVLGVFSWVGGVR